MNKHLLIFIFVTVTFTACTTVQGLKKMKSKNVTYEEWGIESKTVVFIPMAHLANPDFYNSVKNLVKKKKEEGFIVYYELTRMNEIDDTSKQKLLKKSYIKYYRGHDHIDSISQMIYKKKMAKFLGFFPDSNVYRRLIPDKGFFKGMISQPNYKQLGLDDFDKHADVRINKLIDKYEELFGEIMLEEKDFNISLNSTYPKSYRLPKDKVRKILFDYRNEYLARFIQNSPDKKILVIFGLAHMKDTFKELRFLDKKWRMRGSYAQ